jgi:dTDP-4-amino-4,6-dideoxygalactose transaminase
VKLPHLPSWTARRREVAAEYDCQFQGYDAVKTPIAAPDREHVYHLYVIQHERRDALARHLSDRGIPTVINYPVALPFLPAYRRFGHRSEEFPSAHHHQSRILSLPIFPEMTQAQVQQVADAVHGFCGRAIQRCNAG